MTAPFDTVETRLEYGGVTYRFAGVRPTCPLDGSRDWYDIEIEIQPHDGVVPEVNAFRDWVNETYGDRPIWHEDLTQDIKERLCEALNTEGGYVRVSGEHGGVDVRAEVSW